MKFSEKLKQLRKDKGMSQEDLAFELIVSRQAVSKWESDNAYPETDKLIQIGKLFSVSIDYLLNEETDHNKNEEMFPQQSFYEVSMAEMKDYLTFKKKFAKMIGIGVMLCILSLLPPLISTEMKQTQRIAIDEILLKDALGAAGMFLIVAVGVIIFIIYGIKNAQFNKKYEQELTIKKEDYRNLKTEHQQFHDHFIIAMASGVFLCIFALISAILIDAIIEKDVYTGGSLFIFVAIAVYIFIYFGLRESSYQFFLEHEKYQKEKEKEKKTEEMTDRYFEIVMPIVGVLYCGFGLWTGIWHPSWIVFPLTAVIILAYAAIKNKQ